MPNPCNKVTDESILLAGEMAAAGSQLSEISEAMGYKHQPSFNRAVAKSAKLSNAITEGQKKYRLARLDPILTILEDRRKLLAEATEHALNRVREGGEVADQYALRMLPKHTDVVPAEADKDRPIVKSGLTIRVEVPDGNGGWREAGRMKAVEQDDEE